MRIQHNIAAMNSYRNFSANSSSLNKNLEKLSTGYKINRAGDDAAGLAISEKMRAQISGLEGATKNAKDGISLIQTAEGALTEVHDMLNRMTTLAEQSANGTYDNDVDRQQLQKEVQALKDEIDRIADSTNFNGLKLLDGSLAEKSTTEIKELENTGSQIVDMKGTTTGFAVNGFQPATKATYTAAVGEASKGLGSLTDNTKLTTAANDYGAVKIAFTDKDGKDREVTLSTDKITDVNGTTVEDLKKALTGEDMSKFKYDSQDVDARAALDALRDTFDIEFESHSGDTTPGDDTIKFTTKEVGGSGKMTGLHFNKATGSTEARNITLSATDDALTEVASKPEGYEVAVADVTANMTAANLTGKTLTIGGRTYEFNNGNSAGSNSDGVANTVVRIGSTDKETMANLVSTLKADGIDATDVSSYDAAGTLDAGGKATIRFTDASQISETQSGANISTSSSNLAIIDQTATKQTASATIGNAAAASSSFSFRYTDASGEIQEKKINFTGVTDNAANNATAIANALNSDSELKALFDIKADNTTLQINSKVEGNISGQFLGVDTQATDAGISAVTVTAGLADGKTLTMKADKDGRTDSTYNMQSGDTVTVNGQTFQFARDLTSDVGDNIAVLVGADGAASLQNLSKAMEKAGITNTYSSDANGIGKITLEDKDNIATGEVTTVESTGLSLQIGDTSEDWNKLTVSVTDMHAASIGIGDVDISTQEGAATALDKIKQAVNNVSDVRGSLGALQNRLDHTINNLGVMRENIQNAESNIRDTDVAEEMMTYTKNSILNQSAQAMLAQANQLPQGVLQLLG